MTWKYLNDLPWGRSIIESLLVILGLGYIEKFYSRDKRIQKFIAFEISTKRKIRRHRRKPDAICIIKSGLRKNYEVHVIEAKSNRSLSDLIKENRKKPIPVLSEQIRGLSANYHWLVLNKRAWIKLNRNERYNLMRQSIKAKRNTNGIGILVFRKDTINFIEEMVDEFGLNYFKHLQEYEENFLSIPASYFEGDINVYEEYPGLWRLYNGIYE